MHRAKKDFEEHKYYKIDFTLLLCQFQYVQLFLQVFSLANYSQILQ